MFGSDSDDVWNDSLWWDNKSPFESSEFVSTLSPSGWQFEGSQRKEITDAQKEMKKWFREHLSDPYLTVEQEDFFLTKYGLTRKYVKTFFNNQRSRLMKQIRFSKSVKLTLWFEYSGIRKSKDLLQKSALPKYLYQ
jgi:hypothetical protein